VLQRGIWSAIALFLGSGIAPAQWLNYRAPGTPRTPDGKPNLTAPVPRETNGKPDLSGVWQVEPTPAAEMKRLFGDLSPDQALGDTPAAFSKYLVNILADIKPQDSPLRPEFAEILHQRSKMESPLFHCLPIGIPADDLIPGPLKIVDTVGFNDRTWLDGMGHPHSGGLHVSERFHRRDFGHLDVEVTIDDPQIYTRSFSIKFTELLQPDSDVTEYFCNENERDQTHIGK